VCFNPRPTLTFVVSEQTDAVGASPHSAKRLFAWVYPACLAGLIEPAIERDQFSILITRIIRTDLRSAFIIIIPSSPDRQPVARTALYVLR